MWWGDSGNTVRQYNGKSPLLWPSYSLDVGTGWPVFQHVSAFLVPHCFCFLTASAFPNFRLPCLSWYWLSMLWALSLCLCLFHLHCSISYSLSIYRLILLWKNLFGSVHVLGLDKTTGLWPVHGLAVKQQGPR